MRKFNAIFSAVCIICALVFSASAVTAYRRGTSSQEEASALCMETVQDKTEDSSYVVKEFNGKICVYFASNPDTPAIVTDINTCTMLSSDRELLGKGIKVSNKEELLALLEDFGS